MKRKYILNGRALICLLLAECFVTIRFAEADVVTKEQLALEAKQICSAEIPNLNDLYRDSPRKKEQWDHNQIHIVKGYSYRFERGVLDPNTTQMLGPNTPLNAMRSVLYLSFNYPSLRGQDDASLINERIKSQDKKSADYKLHSLHPESLITVSIDRIYDWNNLPVTKESEFWRSNFKPNLTAQQIKVAHDQFNANISRIKIEDPQRYIRYVENWEGLGLREFIAQRSGLFFYEPIGNKDPSPYGVPRFSCDGPSHLGVNGCMGHFKFRENYLVAYQIPYNLMGCWQRVEEGVKRVVDLNIQTVK